MHFNLSEDKFHVRAYFAPCACRCEFCCLGDYPKKIISFDDYEFVLRKFAHLDKSYSMKLRSFIYNCIEHPMLGRQIKLFRELGMDPVEFTQLDINGTRIKVGEELGIWFDELQSNGMQRAAFSWFGSKETHDSFVNCSGYFSYLMDCAKLARRKGIPVVSKVFLHAEMLEELGDLIQMIEEFSDHIIGALMEYSGRAKEMEKSFITKQDFETLKPSVKKFFKTSYMKKFMPEKEWISLAENNSFPEFRIVDYILYLDADNIKYYKNATIDEILDGFRKLNNKLQSSFESINELALRYGNRNCEILYECRVILRKWLDLYCDDKRYDTRDLFSFTNNSVEWKVYERLYAEKY